MSSTSKYLSIKHAAELIDASPWTIRKWIREDKLKYYRFGSAIRINVEDLMSFAEECRPYEEILLDL